jgi:nicotinate-nucleotide adenylyltransferase
MNIALFGGSFDPPHLAHVQVARYLLNSRRYDQVWVIPSKQNPLKAKGCAFDQRLKMSRLAFSEMGSQVQVRDDDEKLSGYTIDLIRRLQADHPKAKFTFIVGSDLREQIPQWKDGASLQKIIDFEFLPRPPAPDSPFLPLSSSEVRQKLAAGEDPKKFLPEKVAHYVQTEQLYRP